MLREQTHNVGLIEKERNKSEMSSKTNGCEINLSSLKVCAGIQ